MSRIQSLKARQVFDSRGYPTVEVEVILNSGVSGRAIVPSGASTGKFEALELRDGDPASFSGKGVTHAVENVNHRIAPALIDFDGLNQAALDQRLVELDGTGNKSSLGANAILGVSLAAARAGAAFAGLPLYTYLGGVNARRLPLPMVNILSGGLHAGGQIDFQDFLMIPVGAQSYSHALQMTFDVYHSTRKQIQEKGYELPGLADEGGFGPKLQSNLEALEILLEAILMAGYSPGKEVAIGLDVASSHFYAQGGYKLAAENRMLDSLQMAEMLEQWVSKYPLISIEDGMAEEDWEGWEILSKKLCHKVQLIGDDLFTTNAARLQQGIERGIANAVLIKVNQIGTLTETFETVELARRHGYLPVISARSGETEDAFIADLTVATGAGQIKIGSIARSSRLAKYNRLLRIEEELGSAGIYQGAGVFEVLKGLGGS
ncbi:MAG: phosphopyruvate hydratase [Acidobacteria bacterium]|nr:phosphopyruvate hydratase [Acidobacteriota bacterium]MCI0628022.1 phosphopyruvate hydratase [Acidobacteriota bacterium]MCI0724679.1 phosphopyruvate hydratase [Acidobacteriota bacterium]